jgi:hypothetical protein
MPPAAMVAAPLAASLLKKKSSSPAAAGSSSAYDVQSQLAQQLFSQTDPIRQSLIGRSQDYLTNGIGASPQFDAFKANEEAMYNQARDNIISDTPAGGALTSALVNLEGNRARDLTQARGAIDSEELARAMTIGTGTTGQALGALGQAGGIQAQIAAANAARNAEKDAAIYSAIGTGVGGYLGSK